MAGSDRTKSRANPTAVLKVMADIIELCRQHGPTEEAYRRALAKMRKLVAFDAATVYAASESDGRLTEVVSVGDTVEILDFLTIGQGDGLAGWTAESKKPLVLADRTGHHQFDPDIDFASFMSLPLAIGDRVVAVVNFGSRTAGTYGAADADLMASLGDQIALAFENIELQKLASELKEQTAKLRDKITRWQHQMASQSEPESVRDLVAKINHDINNALAILVGNVQCMLMEKQTVDQKTVSRLKRMERALLKINEANHKILELARADSKSLAADEAEQPEKAETNV